MTLCPGEIDGAKVVCWIKLDPHKHRQTRATRLYADGIEQSEFFGLAIATYEQPYNSATSHYLFYCDSSWETLNDSLYGSLDEAIDEGMRQFSVERREWHSKP